MQTDFSVTVGLLVLLASAFEVAEAAKKPKNKMEKFQAKGTGVPLGFVDADIDSAQSRLALFPPSGTWLVIMQRFDFSVGFDRNWLEYRNGFGELGLQKEFWLGNEAIHLLTTGAPHKLRIELLTNGSLYHAHYGSFSVDSEDDKYALHISGYRGNATDSMTNKTARVSWNLDGASFSTPDSENGNSRHYGCAKGYSAGWWFNSCWQACLTCRRGVSFSWESLNNLPSKGILTGVRMMVKRKAC